jgi:hypothetical protein
MSPGRWSRRLAVILAMTALAAVAAGPARAAYQATVDVNVSAFSFNCIKINDTYPMKMLSAAVAGYRNLGFSTTGYSGAVFTRAHVLARTPADWGFYVHSHGDHYYYPGGGQYAGFKEDAGLCTGAKTVYSKEIATARAGRQSNLVIMSTCHLGETQTTMPEAFAIPKVRAGTGAWAGPNFYLGYLGAAWDSDEFAFETRFWNALGPGYGVGQAFDVAKLGSFNVGFGANWYGSYLWTGRAGPLPSGCTKCL